MKLSTPLTAANLAQKTGATLLGDGSLLITGANEIHHVTPGDLTFVDFHKYYDKALQSAATVILIDQEYPCPSGKALLVVEEPFLVYNNLVAAERPPVQWNDLISPTATIGQRTTVAAGAAIGEGATIGNDCQIGPNAVIGEGVTLGNQVIIGAGVIIGGDAFYYKKTATGYQAWRSGGTVTLEDDVEIGPGSTVARGVSSPTVIGRGTKLDAQVQIGHDCKIGAHCLLAAQVGIAGNTTVGDWCIFQGQVGVAQNISIGDRTIILAKSGVSKSLEGGKEYFGYPAQEARTAFRDLAAVRRLRK